MTGNFTVQSVSVAAGKNSLHGKVWKGGPQLLLAFHGFSNSSSIFSGLARVLQPHFTTLALDLPGHGSTDWPEKETLGYEDLRRIVTHICAEYGVEKLSLLGFSLGGRVALSTLRAVPEKIRSATLLAPDGLRTHPVLAYANGSRAGNFVLDDLHKHPGRYEKLLTMLYRRKVLNDKLYQFFLYHLSQTSYNDMLRVSWKALRELHPKPAQLRQVLGKYPVPVHLLMGIQDPVIKLQNGEYFASLFPQNVTLHKVSKGHRLMVEDLYPAIAQTLVHP